MEKNDSIFLKKVRVTCWKMTGTRDQRVMHSKSVP